MSVLCLISPTPVLELNRQATFRLLLSLPCPSPPKLAAFLHNYVLGPEILLPLSVFPRQVPLWYDSREDLASKISLSMQKKSRHGLEEFFVIICMQQIPGRVKMGGHELFIRKF